MTLVGTSKIGDWFAVFKAVFKAGPNAFDRTTGILGSLCLAKPSGERCRTISSAMEYRTFGERHQVHAVYLDRGRFLGVQMCHGKLR
jgi:hypothetical protein